MKKFILKLFIISIPVLIILVVYLIKDPFKTIYHYDCYYDEHNIVGINQDHVSVETFLNNYPEYKYNAFIFGSSRSQNIEANYWEHYIKTKPFHFNAWIEGLYGVERKINFLHERKIPIKHAILLIDNELLAQDKNREDYHRKHPYLSGESWISYQLFNLHRYFNPAFLKAYFEYSFTKKITPAMKDLIYIPKYTITYDCATNELNQQAIDKHIEENTAEYYKTPFAEAPVQKYAERSIFSSQIHLLKNIKMVLSKNHTDYKIVISPLYNKRLLDTTDLAILTDIFGSEHIYDFSGVNIITTNKRNYYEAIHFRPHIGRLMLDSIYLSKKRNTHVFNAN